MCNEVDYNEAFRTMLEASAILAEHNEFEKAEELAATAIGLRCEFALSENEAFSKAFEEQ